MSKRDILVLAEGEVTDVKLMERLLTTYGLYEEHGRLSKAIQIRYAFGSLPRIFNQDFCMLDFSNT